MKIKNIIFALIFSPFSSAVFGEFVQQKEIIIVNNFRQNILLHIAGEPKDVTISRYGGRYSRKYQTNEQLKEILKSVKIKPANGIVWHRGIERAIAAAVQKSKYVAQVTIQDTTNIVHFEYKIN